MTDHELAVLCLETFGEGGADVGTIKHMIDKYREEPEGPKRDLMGHCLMFPEIREMSDDERQASKDRQAANTVKSP